MMSKFWSIAESVCSFTAIAEVTFERLRLRMLQLARHTCKMKDLSFRQWKRKAIEGSKMAGGGRISRQPSRFLWQPNSTSRWDCAQNGFGIKSGELEDEFVCVPVFVCRGGRFAMND